MLAVKCVSIQEIFGPILTVYVYKDSEYKDVLNLIDTTTPYALTGSIFADDQWVSNSSYLTSWVSLVYIIIRINTWLLE